MDRAAAGARVACIAATLELCKNASYDQPSMPVPDSKPMEFFEGLRPLPMVICALGGCLFLAAFFVHGFEGRSRAMGLCGIAIVMCGIVVNLLSEASASEVEPHHRSHLLRQSVFLSALAIAIFLLAGYLYRHGTLPGFLPARYDQHHQAKHES